MGTSGPCWPGRVVAYAHRHVLIFPQYKKENDIYVHMYKLFIKTEMARVFMLHIQNQSCCWPAMQGASTSSHDIDLDNLEYLGLITSDPR